MCTKHLWLAIAGAALLTTSAIAQHHGGQGGSMSGATGGSHISGAPHMGSSNPRGTVNPSWHEFNHNAPSVRMNPHRFGSTVLPTPNRWRGDTGRFDRGHWSHGEWHHERHGGHYGWWWVVGPDWYFYDLPVYPYPDSFYPPDEDTGWWYWCEAYQEYYPYVTSCPSGWERVLPRD